MINFEQWEGFEGRIWKEEVNVRDFIQKNYTPYDGDESFLAGPTEATDKLWGALQKLQKAERAKGGVLDMETEVVSSLTAYGPGYIDESLKDLEQIVGLQTDKPLKRAFMPYGGIKMAEQACTTYGYQPSAELHKIFTDYTRTHNQAVFDAYTPEMKAARHTHIITGLPDTYGRGRIVGRLPSRGPVRHRCTDQVQAGGLRQLRRRHHDRRRDPPARGNRPPDQCPEGHEEDGRGLRL